MKFRNIFKIATMSICNLKLKVLLICFVSICSFFLIDQMVTNAARFIYHRVELGDMLTYGEEKTHQLNFTYVEETEEFTQNVNKLVSYIGTLKHVTGAGSYDFTAVYFEQLSKNNEYLEKNKQLFKDTVREETAGISEIMYVNSGISDLCKTKILAGEKSFKELKNQNYLPVLVGYNYKDIVPIGTKLTIVGEDSTYMVKGILKKGTKWFGDVDAIGTNTQNLDNIFIVAREQEELIKKNDPMTVLCTLSTSYYVIDSKENSDLVKKQIKEKSDELGLSTKTNTLEEVLKDYESSYRDNLRIGVLIALMFILFSTLSVSSSTIVSILLRKSEYGIMYANGFSRKDIVKILIMENTFIIFISTFVEICLRKYILQKNHYKAFVQLMSKIHWQITLPIIIVLMIVVICISSIVPMMIVRKMRPVELIGGNE